MVAVEGHRHDDVQTSLMLVRGSTDCNIDSPNECYYAMSIEEELCYGEDIPGPTTRPIPEGLNPWWHMEQKVVLRPLWLSHPLQYTA